MHAFVLERYGKQRALRLADMPEPAVGDYEALIAVHAASVNQLDSKLRDGEFKLMLPSRLPVVLGHDVAGVVVKTGARVQRFKPGDARLVDAGAIRPVIDKVFPFASTNEALAYVDSGRAKGKVVVQLK